MYSLGATLYHAITGHVPFEAPSADEIVAAHVSTPLTPPKHVAPDITQPTSDALMIAMAKDPRERFATFDDFIMAFTAARSQLLVQQLQVQGDEPYAEEGGAGKGWWRR
jgi:serine/threonine protein kinase